jgi:hypothetical protein
MTIQPIFDDAKRVFETLPSSDTLVRAIGTLVRGGASEGEVRGWAGNIVRDYGLPIDRHGEFARIIARGFRLAAPPEATEPEESGPAGELQIDVRPKDQLRRQMSDEHTNEIEPAAPAAIPQDSFAPVLALLTLAADPKAFTARVRELRDASEAAAKAQAELVAARAEHDSFVARERAELEAERATLQKGKVELFVAQNSFDETRNYVAEQSRTLNARLKRFEPPPGSGGVRDFGDPDEEPVFTPPSSYTEPTAGTTITREPGSPRSRKSMRRVT